MEETMYFINKKKPLIMLLIFSIIVIVFYGITYKTPVPFGWNYEMINYFMEVIVDISIGYIVTLMFYIIVVFDVEYKRSEKIANRALVHFARLATYIKLFIEAIMIAYNITDIGEWNKYIIKNIDNEEAYRKLFNKYNGYGDFDKYVDICNDTTYYDIAHHFHLLIKTQMDKIESSYPNLSKEALSLIIEIQNTYIFDYFDEMKTEPHDFVLLERLNDLSEILKQLYKLNQSYNNFYNC